MTDKGVCVYIKVCFERRTGFMFEVNIVPTGSMRVNCYILNDVATGLGAIVDPGGENPANGTERILNKCSALGVKIVLILLTHAHFDHMLSLADIRARTGAPLAVHRYDAEALENPSLSYMKQFAGIDRPEKPAERLLEDGDIIEIGESKLTVMHTPGHTIGSVSYISEEPRFILTGDTLFAGSVGRCDLFGGDEMALHESLMKLKALPGNYTVLPGHGGSTDLQRERADNIFMK